MALPMLDPVAAYLVQYVAQIKVHRAVHHAPAAAYAAHFAIAVNRVAELVHEALAPPLLARGSRVVTGGLAGEQRKHAGVPEPQPLSLVV